MPGEPGWTTIGAIAGAVFGGVLVTTGIPILRHHLPSSDPAELRWTNDSEPKPSPDPQLEKLTTGLADGQELDESLTRRNLDYARPNVSVYSTPNLKPPPPPTTLKDLSDRAQARVVDKITGSNVSPEAAEQRLSRMLAGSNNAVRKDPYRVDRVLIASVARGLASQAADRILWTRILIQPINFTFAGYTVAATENRTLKVAAIESGSTAEFSLDGGLDKLAPNLPTPKLSMKQDRKIDSDVHQQYENLGIDIRPQFLRIIRESATGGDVVGNTAIELSLLTDPSLIRQPTPVLVDHVRVDPPVNPNPVLVISDLHITDDKGRYLEPEQASLTALPQDVLSHCPLKARVWMIYEFRRATAGSQYYLEGAQHAELQEGWQSLGDTEIVPADDIAPNVWSIQISSGNGEGTPLTAVTGSGHPRPVVFSDYTLASQLIHWLKENNTSRLGGMVFNNGRGSTLVPHKHVHNDCLPDAKTSQNASR